MSGVIHGEACPFACQRTGEWMRRVAQAAVLAVGSILVGVPVVAADLARVVAGPFGGSSGLGPLPAGDGALAIRLLRLTVAPDGTWVLDTEEPYVQWAITEGALSFQDPGAGGAWRTVDG